MEVASTALAATLWYSESGSVAGWGSGSVGKGLPSRILEGSLAEGLSTAGVFTVFTVFTVAAGVAGVLCSAGDSLAFFAAGVPLPPCCC